MKTTPILLALLALLGVTGLLSAAPPLDPQSQAIVKQLEASIVPKVDLQDVGIETAVDFLRTTSKELDPKQTGVPFFIAASPGGSFPRITVQMEKASLKDLVKKIAESSHATVKLEPTGITLMPRDSAGEPPQSEGVLEAAQKTSIPLVNIESGTLKAAVDFLNARSAEKKGPTVEIADDVDPSTVVSEVRLRDTNLAEVTGIIAKVAGLHYVVEGKGFRFVK